MKAILTRIRRVEHKLVPAEGSLTQSVAHVLRGRRRRRCEATGERFEELPPLPISALPGRRLSIAETLRRRAGSPNREETGVARQRLWLVSECGARGGTHPNSPYDSERKSEMAGQRPCAR